MQLRSQRWSAWFERRMVYSVKRTYCIRRAEALLRMKIVGISCISQFLRIREGIFVSEWSRADVIVITLPPLALQLKLAGGRWPRLALAVLDWKTASAPSIIRRVWGSDQSLEIGLIGIRWKKQETATIRCPVAERFSSGLRSSARNVCSDGSSGRIGWQRYASTRLRHKNNVCGIMIVSYGIKMKAMNNWPWICAAVDGDQKDKKAGLPCLRRAFSMLQPQIIYQPALRRFCTAENYISVKHQSLERFSYLPGPFSDFNAVLFKYI